MINLLVGRPRTGKTKSIKDDIIKLMLDNQQVCVIGKEEEYKDFINNYLKSKRTLVLDFEDLKILSIENFLKYFKADYDFIFIAYSPIMEMSGEQKNNILYKLLDVEYDHLILDEAYSYFGGAKRLLDFVNIVNKDFATKGNLTIATQSLN